MWFTFFERVEDFGTSKGNFPPSRLLFLQYWVVSFLFKLVNAQNKVFSRALTEASSQSDFFNKYFQLFHNSFCEITKCFDCKSFVLGYNLQNDGNTWEYFYFVMFSSPQPFMRGFWRSQALLKGAWCWEATVFKLEYGNFWWAPRKSFFSESGAGCSEAVSIRSLEMLISELDKVVNNRSVCLALLWPGHWIRSYHWSLPA